MNRLRKNSNSKTNSQTANSQPTPLKNIDSEQ